MTSGPHDDDRGQPPQPRGSRVRLVVVLVIALAFLLVFGYMILIAGVGGD